jgi:methylase of polypeptide subunit release factors
MTPIRASKLLARRLFHVDRFPLSIDGYWDWVTLCLRKALRQQRFDGQRFLDMGCGPAAILSLLAWGEGCRLITAVDVVPEIVSCAREFLRVNDVQAEVVQSDFGSRLPASTFDIISWNGTYIPEAWGEEHGLGRHDRAHPLSSKVTWSGGYDGLRSIERFLAEMPRFLSAKGRILLGFNSFYVREADIRSMICGRGLAFEGAITLPFVGSVVLVIRSGTEGHSE